MAVNRAMGNLTLGERKLLETKPRRYTRVQAAIAKLTNWQRHQWQRGGGRVGKPGNESGPEGYAGLYRLPPLAAVPGW